MKHPVISPVLILILIHLVLIGIAFLFLNVKAFGNPGASLRKGDAMASERLNAVGADKARAGSHPFFQGASQGSGNLNPDVQKMLSEKGKAFVIDPKTDPLIRSADHIITTPLKTIGGQGTQSETVTEHASDEIVTCEAPGEDSVHACKSYVHVDVREELGEPVSGGLSLSGAGDFARIRHLFWQTNSEQWKNIVSQYRNIPLDQIVSARSTGMHAEEKNGNLESFHGGVAYSYRPKVKVAYPSWIDGCGHLESKADRGLCIYGSKVCTQGPGTRVFEGVSVYQGCWEYTYTYDCTHPCDDDCGPLRARGCVQIKSVCKKEIGGACVVYQQTYQCKNASRSQSRITGGDTPFCMDGACRDQTWENNDEMMNAISHLALLKDMQGRFDGFVFKGGANQCSKAILSFKDCCGSGKGWGLSLGLAGCNAEEKALEVKRQKGLCHMVGTYCSSREKITKICLQKKTSYCCFGSKLLKAFHVQGRPQIGRGWGDGEKPLRTSCRIFNLEESKM